MQDFTYSAWDSNGKLVEANAQAANAIELENKLAKNGFLVRQVRPSKKWSLNKFRAKGVKPRAVLSFVQELRAVIEAGVPINEAFKILENRPEEPTLSTALKTLNAEIGRGRSISEALSAQSNIFDVDLALSFQIGTRAGNLTEALARYEDGLALRLELKRKLKKALIYPSFLLGLLAVVFVILFLAILPNFINLYADFGADLPTPTKWLMATVESAPIWLTIIFIMLGLSWLAFKLIYKTPRGRLYLDALILRLPVWGKIFAESMHVQIASSLSLLLHSGMSLSRCVQIVEQSTPNHLVKQKLRRIEAGLATGQKFSHLVQQNALFAPVVFGLLRAGERTGALSEMLEQATKLHKERLNERVDYLEALMEPIMMTVVGGVIGLIVIIVYLPIFSVTDVVQ